MAYTVEHTDTFGGEANYSWVRRYQLPDNLSKLQRVRRAKALCGLAGVRCEVSDFGDELHIRPQGLAQIVFVSWTEQEESCVMQRERAEP